MSEIEVTMTELKQSLGELVNRVAYGQDWVVLVAHGKPKAAIVPIEDLERLRRLRRGEITAQRATTLEDLDALRERIRRRWEVEGIEPVNSADLIRARPGRPPRQVPGRRPAAPPTRGGP